MTDTNEKRKNILKSIREFEKKHGLFAKTCSFGVEVSKTILAEIPVNAAKKTIIAIRSGSEILHTGIGDALNKKNLENLIKKRTAKFEAENKTKEKIVEALKNTDKQKHGGWTKVKSFMKDNWPKMAKLGVVAASASLGLTNLPVSVVIGGKVILSGVGGYFNKVSNTKAIDKALQSGKKPLSDNKKNNGKNREKTDLKRKESLKSIGQNVGIFMKNTATTLLSKNKLVTSAIEFSAETVNMIRDSKENKEMIDVQKGKTPKKENEKKNVEENKNDEYGINIKNKNKSIETKTNEEGRKK